jgi:hypothetical protein
MKFNDEATKLENVSEQIGKPLPTYTYKLFNYAFIAKLGAGIS